MCEFPSWIRKSGNKIFFLIDKDAEKLDVPYQDASSHTALVKLFGEGEHKEGYPVPKEMVSAIQSGKMKKILAIHGYNKMVFDESGYLHAKHESALIKGTIGFWYRHGVLHRKNAPAVVWPNGEKWFYEHGKLLKKESIEEGTFYSGNEKENK